MLRKNRRGLAACLLIVPLLLMLLMLATEVRAETIQTTVPLSPAHEFPPVTNLTATGNLHLSVELTRDADGNLTSAKMNLLATVAFPASVTIQGLHLHEGNNRLNGPVQFDTGLSGSNALTFANGEGFFTRDITNVNLTVLQRLLANPASFYVNLHTTTHPAGAIRGQLTRFTETLARTIALSPANEVPPVNLNATGTATITVNPTRNAKGEIVGGTVSFAVAYDFPGAVTFTGLQVNEGSPNVNGIVRINSGLFPTNSITSPSGKGLFSQTIQVTSASTITSLVRVISSPINFYLNLMTRANPGGAMRGQMDGSFITPPVILQSSSYTLTASSTAATLNVLAVNTDLASVPLIDGQLVPHSFNLNTGQMALQIPADLRANPGLLALQIRSGPGVLSMPVYLNVQASETAAAVSDAAGYGLSVTPDSIASVFGTGLATRTVVNSTATLPTTLDGTTVYVNGIQAPLFFVSPGQINFQVPASLAPGSATVAIRNQTGGVAVARFNLVNISPGIFTRLANGRGAPAALASSDGGLTYPILMANEDGTPVELQVGNIAVLFGTGFRFLSGQPTASAAGIDFAPTYAGAQGQLIGLDQINLFIPESLRGKGETDLVFNLDGKTTNAVRIKVR